MMTHTKELCVEYVGIDSMAMKIGHINAQIKRVREFDSVPGDVYKYIERLIKQRNKILRKYLEKKRDRD